MKYTLKLSTMIAKDIINPSVSKTVISVSLIPVVFRDRSHNGPMVCSVTFHLVIWSH